MGGGLLFTSLSLFFLYGPFSKPGAYDERSSRAVSSKKQNSKADQGVRKPPGKQVRAVNSRSDTTPKIAIIIDDMGFDVDLGRSFLELEPPVTLSVLPTAPHAQAIAQEALQRGAEVLLHLPMEPKEGNAKGPGGGALLAKMSEEEFVGTLNSHLNSIPGIKGVNNHMGSLLTERENKMTLLFRELKRRHLFFVDSRTTTLTVASKVAAEMNVAMAERSVFLDHEPSQEAMNGQWDRFLALARDQGYALMIAHPHRETLVFLKEHLRALRSEARLVHVADIVK